MNDQLTDITSDASPAGIQSRGRARASLNVNVVIGYVEMEDGTL